MSEKDNPEVEDTPEAEKPAAEKQDKAPAGKQPSAKQKAENKAAIKASEKADAELLETNKKAGIVAHIEVLKGVQFHDHQADVLYRRGHLTPVNKLSSWAKRQAKHGLLKIHRLEG
jgi:hypothetical protein